MGLKRFLDEARNMAKFHNHPNIVNIFEYFEANNTAYIVMEFLDGINLNDFLKTNELDFDSCIEITQKICSALAEIHSQNIIHRDVSPDNIFLCMNGSVKLLDFGAARFSADEERNLTIILKPGFAPPEQYDSVNRQGPWTDVYALGATLYLMLTKIKPDESTSRKINDKLKSPVEIDPSISEQVSNTVMKAMALDHHFRFKSIKEFYEALLGNKKVVSLSQEKKARKNRRLFGVLSAILTLTLCSFILITGILDQRSDTALPDASVTFCYPENAINADALNDIIEEFEKNYDNVTITPISVPESEYITSNTVLQTATMFICDTLSEDFLDEYAVNLSEVWDNVNINNYSVIKKYLSERSPSDKDNWIPLGTVVPLNYIISNQDTITEKHGTSLDYFEIQTEFAGKYQINAAENDSGYFTDNVSVNKNASKNEKKVAIRFLDFLLSDYAQEALFVQHGNGVIPVNDSAADIFADVYSELSLTIPVTSYCKIQ